MKFYYQTVTITKNTKSLKEAIVAFLKNQWLWDEDDFKEGMSETKSTISIEMDSNILDELKTDVKDFSEWLKQFQGKSKIRISSISEEEYN